MDWSNNDIQRAKQEGWAYLNGYVTRLFSSNGTSPFLSSIDLVSFLREEGRKSDWHKTVYLTIPWTVADDELAAVEGWRLTYDSILTRRLPVFASNELAREHVQQGAADGDPLCMKALKVLAKRRLLYGDN